MICIYNCSSLSTLCSHCASELYLRLAGPLDSLKSTNSTVKYTQKGSKFCISCKNLKNNNRNRVWNVIIIETRCTIYTVCLNHSETTTHPLHKTGPCAQKFGDYCFELQNHNILTNHTVLVEYSPLDLKTLKDYIVILSTEPGPFYLNVHKTIKQSE